MATNNILGIIHDLVKGLHAVDSAAQKSRNSFTNVFTGLHLDQADKASGSLGVITNAFRDLNATIHQTTGISNPFQTLSQGLKVYSKQIEDYTHESETLHSYVVRQRDLVRDIASLKQRVRMGQESDELELEDQKMLNKLLAEQQINLSRLVATKERVKNLDAQTLRIRELTYSLTHSIKASDFLLLADIGESIKLQSQFNAAVINSSSDIGLRNDMLNAGYVAQIKTGANLQQIRDVEAALVTYGLQRQAGFSQTLYTTTALVAGLGLSASSAAKLAATSMAAGQNFASVSDSVSHLVDTTALGAENAAELANQFNNIAIASGKASSGFDVSKMLEPAGRLQSIFAQAGVKGQLLQEVMSRRTTLEGGLQLQALTGINPNSNDPNATAKMVEGLMRNLGALRTANDLRGNAISAELLTRAGYQTDSTEIGLIKTTMEKAGGHLYGKDFENLTNQINKASDATKPLSQRLAEQLPIWDQFTGRAVGVSERLLTPLVNGLKNVGMFMLDYVAKPIWHGLRYLQSMGVNFGYAAAGVSALVAVRLTFAFGRFGLSALALCSALIKKAEQADVASLLTGGGGKGGMKVVRGLGKVEKLGKMASAWRFLGGAIESILGFEVFKYIPRIYAWGRGLSMWSTAFRYLTTAFRVVTTVLESGALMIAGILAATGAAVYLLVNKSKDEFKYGLYTVTHLPELLMVEISKTLGFTGPRDHFVQDFNKWSDSVTNVANFVNSSLEALSDKLGISWVEKELFGDTTNPSKLPQTLPGPSISQPAPGAPAQTPQPPSETETQPPSMDDSDNPMSQIVELKKVQDLMIAQQKDARNMHARTRQDRANEQSDEAIRRLLYGASQTIPGTGNY